MAAVAGRLTASVSPPTSPTNSSIKKCRRERSGIRSCLKIPRQLSALTAALFLLILSSAGLAQGKNDERQWNSAENSGSRVELEDYLRKFPQGRYRSQAIDRLLDLGLGTASSASLGDDEAAWGRLGEQSSRADVEDYLRRFPQGRHRSAAIDRLLNMGTQVAALAPVKPPATRPSSRPKPAPPAIGKWQHGQSLRDCNTCPELVVLQAGSFRLGSPSNESGRWSDEGPAITVSLRRPLAFGKYEVTRGQYARFARATSRSAGTCQPPAGLANPDAKLELSWKEPGFRQSDDHPVVCVNWQDAQAYAAWLSRETGKRYRLPSEAEWEYAARAGTDSARFWLAGYDTACGFANVADRAAARVFKDWTAAPCDDGQVFTATAGSYRANGFGLHDMLGNVWEWVGDCWNDSHEAGDPHVARFSGDCGRRVIKGASWISIERLVRIAARGADKPEARTIGTGFRVVRELEP